MKVLISLVFVLVFIAGVFAQKETSTKPKPNNENISTQSQNSNRQIEIQRQREAKFEIKRQQSYHRLIGAGSVSPSIHRRAMVFRDVLSPYYRKPTKKELKTIKPHEDDLRKYTRFLKGKNTGIINLVLDAGCNSNSKVLVVSDKCRKYTMPGGGASFSFRKKTYRVSHLSDITYTKSGLIAKGTLVEALFMSLGDVPIDKVSMETKGIDALASIKPSKSIEELNKFAVNLKKGVVRKGFAYARGVLPKQNRTFIMRSIAYQGKWLRAAAGITYNEFEFDKRRDVIIAFRIVRKNEDNSITILWKQLQSKRSPKLEFGKGKKKSKTVKK